MSAMPTSSDLNTKAFSLGIKTCFSGIATFSSIAFFLSTSAHFGQKTVNKRQLKNDCHFLNVVLLRKFSKFSRGCINRLFDFLYFKIITFFLNSKACGDNLFDCKK